MTRHIINQLQSCPQPLSQRGQIRNRPGTSKITCCHTRTLSQSEFTYGMDPAHEKSAPVMPTTSPTGEKSAPVMPTTSPASRSNTEYTRRVKNHLQSSPQPLSQ